MKMPTRRTKKSAPAANGGADLQRRIAEKAHDLFEQRGFAHGDDQADWFEAERLVREELRQPTTRSRRPATARKSAARSRPATPRRTTSARKSA
jgi:hypothetical protein